MGIPAKLPTFGTLTVRVAGRGMCAALAAAAPQRSSRYYSGGSITLVPRVSRISVLHDWAAVMDCWTATPQRPLSVLATNPTTSTTIRNASS